MYSNRIGIDKQSADIKLMLLEVFSHYYESFYFSHQIDGLLKGAKSESVLVSKTHFTACEFLWVGSDAETLRG